MRTNRQTTRATEQRDVGEGNEEERGGWVTGVHAQASKVRVKQRRAEQRAAFVRTWESEEGTDVKKKKKNVEEEGREREQCDSLRRRGRIVPMTSHRGEARRARGARCVFGI
jgi:hypothetical protein